MFFCIWHLPSIASANDTLVPMKKILHPNSERGAGEHGWLSTRYSFSFNTWYDEEKMGFGTLRVLNDDVIAGGQGFGRHGHRDMEIITIVMQGALAHQDSIGNQYVVNEGDVQVMSAGTGVMHSEQNHLEDTSLELFQLWVEPKQLSIEPRYLQKHYDFKSVTNGSVELVGEGSLSINQDAFITYASYKKSEEYTYQLHDSTHGIFIFVIEGSLVVGGETLGKRDALGVCETGEIKVTSKEDTTFLVIEVPMD